MQTPGWLLIVVGLSFFMACEADGSDRVRLGMDTSEPAPSEPGEPDPGEPGSCGDGLCNPPETGMSCPSDCMTGSTCGDGFLQPGEVCDDGNTLNGDGCSSDCQPEPQP